MSRPRKPFGANQPGRLQSTMMKVLAAEMSDPQRSRKGKRYAADGNVIDIEIEPGMVTAEVQGTRATPYVAVLQVSPGDGMPLRRDLRSSCTCPDDEGWNDRICKHVAALMYVFADELLIEPELLDLWRDRDGVRDRDLDLDQEEDREDDREDQHGDTDDVDPPFGGRRGHLRLVRNDETEDDEIRSAPRPDTRPTPIDDPLADILTIPPGRTLPVVPVLDDADLPLPRRPELAAALRDAVRAVRVRWD